MIKLKNIIIKALGGFQSEKVYAITQLHMDLGNERTIKKLVAQTIGLELMERNLVTIVRTDDHKNNKIKFSISMLACKEGKGKK